MFNLPVEQIVGFPDGEKLRLRKLVDVYEYHLSKNALKEKYYDGKISIKDVNIGIALPTKVGNIKMSCEWATKAVDVLAARSMFDGYVSLNGENNEVVNQIVADNKLIAEYIKACKDELKFGCTFATLSADENIGCKIRFHSPNTAAALWNGDKNRIDCGFAIIDTVPDEKDGNNYVPSHINYYTDDAVWELIKVNDNWRAVRHDHIMHRPLMEALIWNATTQKPLGKSRIKASIRSLVDANIRTKVNATIALEFSTTPQKFLLGVTDEQYDALVSDKFKQYAGSLIAATANPETGQNPTFGQVAQGSLAPHIEMMRMLATQFSAETGLSVTDTGVVNDANPTSSDAILAQSQTLISLAEQLNITNGSTLNTIAKMALAIMNNTSLEELDDDAEVIAHFKNPAMPSVAVTADAAIKIASSRAEFASTDVFLEMIGFDAADIARIKAQEARIRGQKVLDLEFEDANQSEDMDEIQGPTE